MFCPSLILSAKRGGELTFQLCRLPQPIIHSQMLDMMLFIMVSKKTVLCVILLQVKLKPWERRLVDESYGNQVSSLLKKASEREEQYLKALPKPGGEHK